MKKSLADKIKVYLSVFKIRMIHSLQYRAAAIAGLLTQFFWGFMLLMIFEAFYNSGGAQTFSFSSLSSYIWIRQALLAFFMIWLRDSELGNIIINGNIAYELVRPYSMYTFWYSKLLGTRVSSAMLRAPLVLILAVFLPAPYTLNPPANISALLLSITGLFIGVFLMTSILMLMYISMFKTHNMVGSFILFGITADFFGGHYIPIPLMPNWLQKISSFMPFRYASDLPLRIYTGDIVGNEALYGILIEIFWLVSLFALGSYLMRRVSKKVVVFGG